MTRHLSAKLLLVAAMASLSACATNKDAITKVQYYHLDADKRIVAADPAIAFEQKRLLHGAVENEEMRDREGHYYTVFWTVADKSQPVKILFEYRQSLSRATVHKLEVTPETITERNITYFQVSGPAYVNDGRVTAWKVSVMRGSEVVATSQSFLWQ